MPVRTQDVPGVQGNDRHPRDSLLQISSSQTSLEPTVLFLQDPPVYEAENQHCFLNRPTVPVRLGKLKKRNKPQVYSSLHR